MPATDPLAAKLAAIKERSDWYRQGHLMPMAGQPAPAHASAKDVPALLAALNAVLAPHKPGPYVILGRLCRDHKVCRDFSITAGEAQRVAVCIDCSATVYTSCDGCGGQVSLGHCRTRALISRELLSSKEGHDA